ncbi:MAG: hypothetical protein NVS3B10_27990 [Polyangiales bacterium]
MRVVMWLGLLVARTAVWLTVGVVVPLLLSFLSLVLGKGLQRASTACREAASRAGAAMQRASRRAAGEEVDEPESADERRVRIGGDHILHGVRVVTPEQAQLEAIRAAERHGVEDAEEWAARRASEEADRWEPPEAWVEREEREQREEDERRERQAQQENAREKRNAARRPR